MQLSFVTGTWLGKERANMTPFQFTCLQNELLIGLRSDILKALEELEELVYRRITVTVEAAIV